MPAQPPVLDSEAACENIKRFSSELARNPKLVEIMSYARAWYAWRAEDGIWSFGPSKFVGYADNTGAGYLKTHASRDGRLTERVLSNWFEPVEPSHGLFPELSRALGGLFARFGRTPNKLLRLNVLRSELELPDRAPRRPRPASSVSRITVNPDVCAGRPCIRGMRIRVGDILELLAAGVDRAEILADYPYLEGEDIDAALEYAARALDHRIIRAA